MVRWDHKHMLDLFEQSKNILLPQPQRDFYYWIATNRRRWLRVKLNSKCSCYLNDK
jgi:hypothetical protein